MFVIIIFIIISVWHGLFFKFPEKYITIKPRPVVLDINLLDFFSHAYFLAVPIGMLLISGGSISVTKSILSRFLLRLLDYRNYTLLYFALLLIQLSELYIWNANSSHYTDKKWGKVSRPLLGLQVGPSLMILLLETQI